MGLYGAIIVLPAHAPAPALRGATLRNLARGSRTWGSRLPAGCMAPPTTTPASCYDREYLFQFSEMDPSIHTPGGGAGPRKTWLASPAQRAAVWTSRPSPTIPRTS